MKKHYTFITLEEAAGAYDLGRVMGGLFLSIRKIFGRNKKIERGIRQLVVDNLNKNGWTDAAVGPRSPLMRELQRLGATFKMLRDSGQTSKIQAATKEVETLLNNSIKTHKSSTADISARIKEIADRLKADTQEAFIKEKSSGSIKSMIDSASRKTAKAEDLIRANTNYLHDTIPGRTEEIIQPALKGVSTKTGRAGIIDSIRSLRLKLKETTDPTEYKAILARLEALKSKLAKHDAIKRMDSTAAFKQQQLKQQIKDSFMKDVDPAASSFYDNRVAANRLYNQARGIEDKVGQPISNKIRGWWNKAKEMFGSPKDA